MRAASAWGDGGSNTITVNQMPAHSHTIPKHYVYDKTGWSAPINGLSLPQVANPVPSTTPFATIEGLDNVTNTGGGQHSILRTRMFGRGTELLKEGDASCVTFNKFKSVLRMALRKFAHFRLATFICQLIQRVQQALTVVHGYLSQMISSCGQAVRGTLPVEQAQTRTITGCRSVKRTGYLVYQPRILADGQTGRNMNYVRVRLLTVFSRKTHTLREAMQTLQRQQPIQQLFQRFRLTAPVIAGTAPLSLMVM